MKKAKRELKYTLSGQMTAIFVGLLVFVLMLVFIVNTGFLGRYYMSHKQKDLIEMYEEMSEAVNNGNLGNEAVQKKLVAELEKTNIDVCAMDISDDGKVVFTNVKEEGFLYKQMLRIFFLKDDDQEKILKHSDDYVVRKIRDPQSGTDYLEMWGYLSDSVFVTMRSPLDSIRESANLANQFLIYLGIFGMFFGGILVWIFSRRITKPVLELARLSEDMANLNFDAKYTSGGKNEIGVLGENFNKMSDQLEKTISELKTANNQLQQDIEQKEKLENMRNEFLGNVSHELKNKTDPEVEFFDIEDKSANNGTVAPGVKYSDVNYMESGVDITIKGAKHDKTELSGNRTNIANGESIKMEDFKHDEETDDVYTMTAVIKDKAGNETEKEVMFSVNRFGSNYIFSETTEKFLDDVYANKPKDLVVTEVNVDSLVFNGISYGLDGTKKELKAGSDYTVKQSGGEGSWKEYTYTIKKENFEKEGRYSVTIDSEDKATNKMNNKVKECNIDFVIDKTPPTVVITGIEESSYRADEREMTINLSDNTAVKSVDVIIDGKSVATYAQKEIEKAGGKISYMIEGASEPQKIEAAALDMAGNETTSEMHKVLVTSSVWIQYINNTPLLIGSILGIVLVAGGLIWFFVIRKKKEESK